MGRTEKGLEKPTEEQIKALIGTSSGESIEEPRGETKEEVTKKPEQLLKKHRKLLMGAMIVLFTFLVIYLGVALYFRNHFYFGTTINGINISGKTLEDAKVIITTKVEAYTLNIKERGGSTEQIRAKDVGLMFNNAEELNEIKDSQKSLRWLSVLFARENLKKKVVFTYDERLLKKHLNKLTCFKPENIVEPKNPTFKYKDKNYVIVKEVLGNRVDKAIFYSKVADSIRNGEAEIDLESKGCYVLPQYYSASQIVLAAKNILNQYVAAKTIYKFGNTEKTLDGSLVNQWLIVNKNYQVTVNEENVKTYIKDLANTYNTVGKTRKFTTSTGKTINISGGDYGRAIDKVREKQYIISAIKAGKIITREPIFKQNAFSHDTNDIGNTYVEISIAKQHLWFFKNGTLIVQGPVVTGNTSLNRSTHKGIYSLKYIARNVVLRGPDYAAPVHFWMPFDGGIGIHDASWRSVFGGNIYKFNGSHGCVNSPYNVAKKIYYNISPGTPVIVH